MPRLCPRPSLLVPLPLLLATACATAPPQKTSPPVTESPPPPPPTVTAPPAPQKPALPRTRTEAIADTLFGAAVADPYRWLEDAKSSEVQAWMSAQDEYARSQLASLPGREALTARLKALYYVDSISPPLHRGDRFFYGRTHADKEKGIHYVRDGEDGPERVLLDPNTMSADGSVSVGPVVASWDGKRVAYALKPNNSDEAVLHVLDVDTMKTSEIDVIEGGKYAHPSWTPDSRAFYYTWIPTDPAIPVADRPGYAEIRLHVVGEDPKKDVLVRGKTGDPQTFLGVEISRDGRWLFVTVQHGWNATDVYVEERLPGVLPGSALKPFAVGVPALYSVDAWKNRFYVLTNEGAPRYRVFTVDPKQPARAKWKEIVPESDSVIENAQILGGRLVVTRMRNAASEMEVRELDGKLLRKVALPGIGSSRGMSGNPDEDTAYFTFHSFTQPLQVWKTSIAKGSAMLWAEVKVPIDPSRFVVEQVFYPSKDGTRISMFVVHRKDLALDGRTPFLLGGYGGFNISMLPGFSSGLYPWLEAGGGYAMPNLRGGGEYGEEWHKAGMLAKKQNVFDDFIAAAEFLVSHGYTSPERLAIRGGSNGGLLVGAVLTQRPELFRAVICAVPLLDMVRYHKFGSGKTWIPEYGSADDEAGFKTLFAYSPYHQVREGIRYPATLFTVFDQDTRVDPMHARKMCAALQFATAAQAPILIRNEANVGHGARSVSRSVELSADVLAFMASVTGLNPGGSVANDGE